MLLFLPFLSDCRFQKSSAKINFSILVRVYGAGVLVVFQNVPCACSASVAGCVFPSRNPFGLPALSFARSGIAMPVVGNLLSVFLAAAFSDRYGAFLQQFHQYQVVGRALPTPANETPKAYRMKLWATDEVRAKSKFWYDHCGCTI